MNYKLTTKQLAELKRRAVAGERGVDLAREFGVSTAYVSELKKNRGVSRPRVSAETATKIRELVAAGEKKLYVAVVCGVSIPTVTRYSKENAA